MSTRAPSRTGARAIQLHTGGMCHLDAYMTEQGLDELVASEAPTAKRPPGRSRPGDFGERGQPGVPRGVRHRRLGERDDPVGAGGDDKPLKYPGIFQHAGALLLNKVDVAAAFDFDLAEYNHVLDDLNPTAPRFEVSARHGQGMDAWCDWLLAQIANKASRA